ncbi:hypothetical protein GW17_00016085 [Ensete ventricosum]|nr:hypothetical protein GW17_00016085 [Ensete ventricosum]
MHRVDAVGNSPGVRLELTEGIRSLPGWRKGVRLKKTETHWKIWDLAESLLGDSSKGWGSSLGARREIAGRRPDDLPQECRSQHQVKAGILKVEGTTFEKISVGKPPVSDGCTAIAQAFGWLTAVDPLRLGG